MFRLMLITLYTLSILLFSDTLVVVNDAYAGCCMCGHKTKGCTPPGKLYKGILCPKCIQSDPEIARLGVPEHLMDIKVILNLPFTTAQSDMPDRLLTLVSGGECIRPSLELRLLGSVSNNLSL